MILQSCPNLIYNEMLWTYFTVNDKKRTASTNFTAGNVQKMPPIRINVLKMTTFTFVQLDTMKHSQSIQLNTFHTIKCHIKQ